jgi:methylated-DNA-[protein]-cysteine S-methyltransferase
VRFSRTPIEGPVPVLISQYLAGQPVDLINFVLGTPSPSTIYNRIYREVQNIPYGETATYGEIAKQVGTGARVVGQALSRNPVPLIVPCHRVVTRFGLGGFTPDPEIKISLLTWNAGTKEVLLDNL